MRSLSLNVWASTDGTQINASKIPTEHIIPTSDADALGNWGHLADKEAT